MLRSISRSVSLTNYISKVQTTKILPNRSKTYAGLIITSNVYIQVKKPKLDLESQRFNVNSMLFFFVIVCKVQLNELYQQMPYLNNILTVSLNVKINPNIPMRDMRCMLSKDGSRIDLQWGQIFTME